MVRFRKPYTRRRYAPRFGSGFRRFAGGFTRVAGQALRYFSKRGGGSHTPAHRRQRFRRGARSSWIARPRFGRRRIARSNRMVRALTRQPANYIWPRMSQNPYRRKTIATMLVSTHLALPIEVARVNKETVTTDARAVYANGQLAVIPALDEMRPIFESTLVAPLEQQSLIYQDDVGNRNLLSTGTFSFERTFMLKMDFLYLGTDGNPDYQQPFNIFFFVVTPRTSSTPFRAAANVLLRGASGDYSQPLKLTQDFDYMMSNPFQTDGEMSDTFRAPIINKKVWKVHAQRSWHFGGPKSPSTRTFKLAWNFNGGLFGDMPPLAANRGLWKNNRIPRVLMFNTSVTMTPTLYMMDRVVVKTSDRLNYSLVDANEQVDMTDQAWPLIDGTSANPFGASVAITPTFAGTA